MNATSSSQPAIGTLARRYESRRIDSMPTSSPSRCAARSLTDQPGQTVGAAHCSSVSLDKRSRSASRISGKRAPIRIGCGCCIALLPARAQILPARLNLLHLDLVVAVLEAAREILL